MDPVLIYIDEERIVQEKAALAKAVIFFQALYDAFKGIGLTVTMAEMNNLGTLTHQNHGINTDHLSKFVKDKLLTKAGQPDFNGVQFNRSLLEAHLVMPDLTSLENILKEFVNLRIHNSMGYPMGIRINLIDFVNEVFSKKVTADATLETEFAHYTKTDLGATLAGHLNTICDGLNNFATVYPPGQFGVGWGLHYADGVPIPGITVRNSSFIPDLDFIRKKEALGSI